MTRPAAPAVRSLLAFQEGFADALFAQQSAAAAAPEIARLVAQPAFAVHRNTVMKGCIDALQANYPAVVGLAGDDWFRAAAADYIRDHPPEDAALLAYGGNFPNFLAACEAGGALRCVAEVARLDRFWTEAHIARDEAPVAAAAIALLAPWQLGATVLRPHAAAHWAWFDECPAATIWERSRFAAPGTAKVPGAMHEIVAPAEGILITRPHDQVKWTALAKSGCAFLDVCAASGTLAAAATAALRVEPGVDLAGLMARTLAAGAFVYPDPDDKPTPEAVR